MNTHFFKIRPELFPAFFVFATALSACHSPAPTPFSQGEPSQSLDAWLAQDTAEFLCRYSRGPFPNWALWNEYSQFLAPDEIDAIRDVSARFTANIAQTRRPRYFAISRFIAKHTSCRIDETQNGSLPIRDESGAVGINFVQSFPNVPNIPEIEIQPDWTADDIENEWIRAFDEAFDGKMRQRNVMIILEPSPSGGFQLRSDVQNSYSLPIKAQAFWEKLDSYQLDDASELAMAACIQQNPLCKELHPYITAAQRFRASMQERFDLDVEIIDPQMTLVSLTENNAYTAVSLTLKNNGSRNYSHIILSTDEVTPQLCELQNERTKKTDRPVELHPGETTKAWCALSSNTRPWTKLSYFISD